MSKISYVKALAANRWGEVFKCYSGFGKAMTGSLPQVPCPQTGKGDTVFRFFKDWEQTGGGYHNTEGPMPDGIEVISWYERISTGEALNTILQILGGKYTPEQAKNVHTAPSLKVEKKLAPSIVKRRCNNIKELAVRTISANRSEVVANYLRSRGLKGDFSKLPDDLRYAENVYYPKSHSDDGLGHYYNAMIGKYVHKSGRNLTLHRHYLDDDGRRVQQTKSKLIMSPPSSMKGGYIHIDEPLVFESDGEKYAMLGYAEGIETCLAIREAVGIPMRATYSNTLMSQQELIVEGVKPENVMISIWADKDRSEGGITHAVKLESKMKELGYDVEVYLPSQSIPEDKKSIDWLDVYRIHGASVFPVELDPRYRLDVF